jgi:uncharacterized protein (TIGR02099 family)
MDQQKDYIEAILQERYGVGVDIGSISASWKGIGPAIVLENVAVKSDESSPLRVAIEKTEIEVKFWPSLLSRRVNASHFNLIGVDVAIDLDTIKRTESEVPIVDVLKKLFLEQLQVFSITDSTLNLSKGGNEQSIILQQLFWRNDGENHQGIGIMRVLELASNSVNFTLNLNGGIDELEGVFFARARELDISPWLKNALHEEKVLQQSRANFVLWSTIQQSRIVSAQASFEQSEFSWQDINSGDNHRFMVKSGDVYAAPDLASRHDGDWLFELQDLMVKSQDAADVVIGIKGQYALNDLTLELTNGIDISPLLPIASAFMSENGYQSIKEANPQLTLSHMLANRSDDEWGIKLGFDHLSINENGLVPGLEGISGEVTWLDRKGHMVIESTQSQFLTDNLLKKPLAYDLFSLDAYIDMSQPDIELFVPSVTLVSNTLSFEHRIHYAASNKWLGVSGVIGDMSVTTAKTLLPSLMKPKTLEFLDKALVDGYVEGGRVLWNGALDQFPFNDKQGVFQAGLSIKGVEFNFDDRWSNIVDTDLEVLFENYGLFVSADEATIKDVSADNISAVIPKLHIDSYVNIKAEATDTSDDLTDLILNSSLSETLGKALTQLPVEDTINADIDLVVPLTGRNIVAQGGINFDKNQLTIKSAGIVLEQLTGRLLFKNEKLNGNGLSANYLGLPTQFDIQADQVGDEYKVDAGLTGNWPIKGLFKDQPEIAEYVDGLADWQGTLAMVFPKDGFNYELQIQSNLERLVSEFPSPLNKELSDIKRLLVSSEGDLLASNVNMTLGDDIKFNGILPHKELVFSRAHLAIGNDNFVGMGIGFSVSVDVPALNFMPWFDTLNYVLQPKSQPKRRYIEAPKRIFIKTDELNIAGFPMHEVEVNVRNTDLSWHAAINADETRAEIDFFHEWESKGIDAKADYFFLTEKPDEIQNDGNSQLGKLLPPISFDCQQCRILGYDFGHADIRLEPADSGMRIAKLEVDTKHANLKAEGDWFVSEDNNSTRLKGDFVSSDFGDFLKELDRDSGVRDSGAVMGFDLSWTDAPYAFDIATLAGDVNWELDDGNLSQISDKGARIFSLLSLDSLVRKLSLDFRDVFAKGFFYNEMSGSFHVNNGVVYTNDTEIDGAAADISLVGSTDLKTQEINYDVAIQPELTSSLPAIVGWLAFDPVSAAVAFAVDRAVKSARVVADIKYKLTGSISEPELLETERSNKDIVLPAQVIPKEKADPTTDHLLIEKGDG